MSYPINYPTPQGANVQIFIGSARSRGTAVTAFDWIKPQGASFVWFTLIAPGGGGGSTASSGVRGGGGGSGAVTNFMCPAFLIPSSLQVFVALGGTGANAISGTGTGFSGGDTTIVYQEKNGAGYTLLTANGGGAGNNSGTGGGAGGAAMTANAFTAMGFFQSIAGQDGRFSTGSPTPSTTNFLSGGGSSGSSSNQANYGYTTPNNNDGFFQISPIIVSTAQGGMTSAGNQIAGIGSGGTGINSLTLGGNAGDGGPGLAVIITW